MKKRTKLILIAFLLSAFGLQAQETELNQLIEKSIKEYELPGLAISTVVDGEVKFQKAYGTLNQETNAAVQTNSLFGIASLSKAFTATSIAMLVDDGKINWTDRVQDYIPAFKLSDEYVASQLTIEDLLCHRSGFNTFDGDLLWYGTNYSREEIIKRFSKYKMKYDFRTKYGYQNIMFIIAGEVVEQVSGMTWDAFVEERIFKPLQMNNSYTSINQIPSIASIAMPHVKGQLDELRNYDNSGGAAALVSNVEDLSQWIKFWLNEGRYGGDTLLQASTHRKLLELHTPIAPSSFDRSNDIQFKGYAQGWFLMDYEGQKVAHHGGGLPGYISKIYILPGKNMGGIILSNGETSLPTALMYSSIDAYVVGKSKRNWPETYLAFSKRYEAYLKGNEEKRAAARNSKLKSNIDQEDLIGEYEDQVYGKAKVMKEGNRLMFSMLPAKEIFSSEMVHWQQNTYQVQFKDKFLPAGYLTFECDANGQVIGFKVDLPNPDFHFYNLDFRKVNSK